MNFAANIFRGDLSGKKAPSRKRTNDGLVIAVMGPTGTGKTSFIRSITGQVETLASKSLKSDTQQVKPVTIPDPDGSGRSLTLVDTPGFDDTYRTDAQVLGEIATWLAQNYEEGSTLNGLIYLCRISDNRMAGEALKNLEMFKKLCGEETLSNVVLVTTMWDEVEPSVGEEREKELKTDFWRSMIARGSQVARHTNSPASARQIIDLFREKGRVTTHIAHEIVDRKMPLDETDAGSYLRGTIAKLAAEHRRVIDKLLREHQEAMKKKDEETQRQLEDQKAYYEHLIEQLVDSKAQLARRITFKRMLVRDN